jgi:hypothetical protein
LKGSPPREDFRSFRALRSGSMDSFSEDSSAASTAFRNSPKARSMSSGEPGLLHQRRKRSQRGWMKFVMLPP